MEKCVRLTLEIIWGGEQGDTKLAGETEKEKERKNRMEKCVRLTLEIIWGGEQGATKLAGETETEKEVDSLSRRSGAACR
ncbi:unnamed protein product, partial [Iphiclides podalirius]